jgi:hypothetical protein
MFLLIFFLLKTGTQITVAIATIIKAIANK